jgi:hypothetical protein
MHFVYSEVLCYIYLLCSQWLLFNLYFLPVLGVFRVSCPDVCVVMFGVFISCELTKEGVRER